jgi:nucleoside phosphorylase/tetratricopeptide (TPR) repeat protein
MVPVTAPADATRAEALRPRVAVGIITALPKEFAAVKAMLEGPVEDGFPGKVAAEYVLGEIPAKGGGTHAVAVVLAGMGQNLAAGRATLLLQHYAGIDAILMVGIAGGVPCPERADDHVALGDIVASDHRGVVQYDFVKETRTGEQVVVEHRFSPRPPSARLLRAVGELEVAALEGQRPWLALIKRARKLKGSARPEKGQPRVLKGPIASANVLLKDADRRDALRDTFKVKAVEMEASGVADAAWEHTVGYLVVRGICDHCDAHKGDAWQMYAAVVAAAYARAVLEHTRSSDPGPPPPPEAPPKSAPLPPNNLPPRRLFIGREEDLRILAEALARDGRASIAQAGAASIHGLGGVGKTALALEYAHRHVGAYPGGVWWLAAEGKPLDGLVRLAGILQAGAPLAMKARVDLGAREAAVAAEAARMALQNHPEPSLLVLDNVDDPGWVERVPSGGKTCVLLTTRDASLALGESALLGKLQPGEATALAEAIAGVPASAKERGAMERILLGELGGLAVAVELSARAVREWALGWRAYEEHLRRGMEAVLKEEALLKHYPRGVFAALDLSIEQCKLGTPERALLEGAAVFAPEGVPARWALKAAGLDPKGLDAVKARTRLSGLGLLEAGKDKATVSMHRLVHRRVQGLALKNDGEAWAESSRRGAECVRAWLDKTVDPTRMAEIDAKRAQVDAALEAAVRAGSDIAWIEIADSLAKHLQHRAIYGEARAWLEQALTRVEQLDPPQPSLVARILSNLALVLQELGQADAARPLLQRSLAIVEETYGPEHPGVTPNLSNLAMVLRDLGQAHEARPLLQRSLAIAEKTYGSEHPNVAIRLSNLATVLKDLGQAHEARPLLQRSLAIAEKTYGPEHPTVAARLSNLAVVLRDLGQADEARPLLQRSLAIVEKTYGPEHPEVAARLSNLAIVLMDLGQTDEVRSLLQRALAIDEKTYGPEHPEIATDLSNLAMVLHALGQTDETRPLLQRAMAIAERSLPPEHPLRTMIAGSLRQLLAAL